MKVGIEGAIVGGVVGVVSVIVYTWWSKRKQRGKKDQRREWDEETLS